MESDAKPRTLAFGKVEIDLVGRRVSVDGHLVTFEPKAFEVLALLARSPGKAFTRDEILDAVWGHRHVTPAVLNRVVMLIRQSLGPDADGLHTVHGVGYRLDAEIRTTIPSGNGAPIALAANLAPATVEAVAVNDGAGERSSDMSLPVEAATPATSAATCVPTPATPATPATTPSIAPSATPVQRFDVSCYYVLGALFIAVLLLAVGAALRHAAAPKPAPVAATTSPMLVVLPLRTVGSNPAEAAFAAGLSKELTTRLAHVDGLGVISQTSVTLAEQRADVSRPHLR